MNKDQIKGRVEQATGKVKEVTGKEIIYAPAVNGRTRVEYRKE